MAHDLFESVSTPPAGVGSGSRLTVPLSLAAHALALLALVVVPLVATSRLPLPREVVGVMLGGPTLPPEPPRPVPPRVAARPTTPINPDAAPLEAPEGITAERPRPAELDLSLGDPGTAAGAGVVPGLDAVPAVVEPLPPPLPRAPVRVGGSITAPRKVHDVPPSYPAVAQAARLEGLVIIQATIGVDGNVVDAQVLRPDPLFTQAALDAVRQWRYSPTSLNGEPVAVVMTVTVSFRLR